MIPDTSIFTLSPDLVLDIETAITDLPVSYRYNERQIMRKLLDNSAKQYGDPTSNEYAEKMHELGIDRTSDIDRAIWCFFDEYHVGKKREPKIKN